MIKLQILKFIQTMIDQFKERYIVLIQDLLPFLAETLDDENNEVNCLSN